MSGKPIAKTELIKPTESALAAPVVVQLGNAEANTGSFSFGLLWNALRQRLRLTLPLAIVLSAASCGGLWYFTQDVYRSSAWLKIVEKRPYLVTPTMEHDHSSKFSQTQLELLRSRPIISRAIEVGNLLQLPEIRTLDPREDPVTWITQHLKVMPVNQSELYEVSFITAHPESARRVVAAIVEAYDKHHSNEADELRKYILGRLQEVKETRRNDIEVRRERLRELAKLAGGDRVPTAGKHGAQAEDYGLAGRLPILSALRKEYIASDIDLQVRRTELAFLKEKIDESAAAPEEELEAAIAADPRITRLEADRVLHLATLERLGEKHERYKREQANHERLQQEIDSQKEKLRPSIRKEVNERVAIERKTLLSSLETEVTNLERMTTLLREKVEHEQKGSLDHSDQTLELEFAQNELTKSEETAQRVLDRIIHLETESGAPGQVVIMEKATLPLFPEGPTLVKKLTIVGLAGFLAPFALFLGWDLVYRRVFEREQLQREVQLRFVSEVAALPTRPLLPRLGSGSSYKRQLIQFEESVNSLRTTLSVEKSVEGCQVFVLASAVSGEGKTNLSSQLAMSWSQAEPGKVLIVDADLRSPNIHDLFEVQPGPGLAEVLRGECALEDAVAMDWGDRLYILPAGDLRADSASQLFSGAPFRELLVKLRSQYHKIVIDVPPVLCASEVLLVAKEADAVVMCTLHDHSRAGQFKLAHDRLVAAGANVVGAVLNGAPIRQYSYDYRGYGAS